MTGQGVFIKKTSHMSTETGVKAGMNLIETNLIEALPENPFIMLRSQHESAERRERGREREKGRQKGTNCINECLNFVVGV